MEPHTVPDLPSPVDQPFCSEVLQFMEASVELPGVREGLPEISDPNLPLPGTIFQTTPPIQMPDRRETFL